MTHKRRAPLSLRRRCCGQMLPLFVFGLLALLVFIVAIIDTGRLTNRRIEAQNAADAAAMTQATEIARALNIVSMNNVAITQTVAVNISLTALMPVLMEATVNTLRKAQEYIACCETVLGCLACGPASWDLFWRVALPLGRLHRENPYRKLWESHQAAVALSNMNRRIVDGFEARTAKLQDQILETNGVAGRVAFYAEFPGGPPKLRRATALPVVRARFDLLAPLCASGDYGTPEAPELFANFAEHGYPRGQGPYAIARDGIDAAITPPVRALGGFPHFAPTSRTFREIVDLLWPVSCRVPTLTGPYPREVAIYKASRAPLLGRPWLVKRDDWSVLAVIESPDAGAVLMPGTLQNSHRAIWALAQAEVRNGVSYDLYTQDWHAKLVPARLATGTAAARVVEAFAAMPRLQSVFERLERSDARAAVVLH